MAEYNSTQYAQFIDPVGEPLKVNESGGKVRVKYFTFSTAGHLDGDTVQLCSVPNGARVILGYLFSSATLGTATIEVGISGDDNKYLASGTMTAGKLMAESAAHNTCTETTAEEIVTLTYGTANPSSVTVSGWFFYCVD